MSEVQQGSNNRQDIWMYGDLQSRINIPCPQTDFGQMQYNKAIRRNQVDRQLGLSYVKLENEMQLFSLWLPENPVGKQFITIMTDATQRVFIAGKMALTIESEFGMIIPLMMPDPDRPKMTMVADEAYMAENPDAVLTGKHDLAHCNAEAVEIVKKARGTRAKDGCYPERHCISYCYWPTLQESTDFMNDVRAAMQYYIERAIWADDPAGAIINAEQDEHENIWA